MKMNMEEQGWLKMIERRIQELLMQSALQGREVKLLSRPDLGLEIVVDGKVYRDIDEITDVAIRNVIATAVTTYPKIGKSDSRSR